MSMPNETARPVDPARPSYLRRFFGGAPLAVIFRLLLLSILVGIILEVLGLDPQDIYQSVRILILRVWSMGFDAVRWLQRYLVLGAVVVIPIWLVVRLMRLAKGR